MSDALAVVEVRADGSVGINPNATVVELADALRRLAPLAAKLGEARFTQEDVALVSRIASECDGADAEDDERVFPDSIVMRGRDLRHLRSLASRIAAVLPPASPRGTESDPTP